MTLSGGVIRESPIGLNIQDADFDFAQSITDVSFEDVDRNVDTQTLPIPVLVDLGTPVPEG